MIYLAVTILGLHLALVLILLYGQSRVRTLPASPPDHEGPWPKASILIPARNEEAEIEHALKSVLNLDYADYEVIVIDDRSTDGTGKVLERLGEAHARLRIVTVATLPPGWLGKNHALDRGAALATGELLLFTDADIVFARDCLRKAVAVMLAEGLDHLTLSPALEPRSQLLSLMVAVFCRNFTLFVKPWRVRNPKSRCFIGIGAFNLVRAAAYRQVGGHETIRLRPDDDMKLGKILKRAGFRQDVRFAFADLSLSWYQSFGAMIRGLEKNVLAGLDYRVGLLLLSLTVLTGQELVPWILIVIGDGPVRIMGVAAAALSALGFGLFFRQSKTSWLLVPLAPWAALLLVYIFARSAFLTLVRGGILWRDTFYPLGELRQNAV